MQAVVASLSGPQMRLSRRRVTLTSPLGFALLPALQPAQAYVFGGGLSSSSNTASASLQLEPVAGGVCEEESALSNKASILELSAASRLFSSLSCSASSLSCLVRCSMS